MPPRRGSRYSGRSVSDAGSAARTYIAELWKGYEAYLQRKERIIEVTTLVYVGAVITAVVKPELSSGLGLAVLAVGALGMPPAVFGFVLEQFDHRARAAAVCNATQSLMAKWLTDEPPASALTPECRPPRFAGVPLPRALWDEMDARDATSRRAFGFFEVVVYTTLAVSTYFLWLRAWSALSAWVAT